MLNQETEIINEGQGFSVSIVSNLQQLREQCWLECWTKWFRCTPANSTTARTAPPAATQNLLQQVSTILSAHRIWKNCGGLLSQTIGTSELFSSIFYVFMDRLELLWAYHTNHATVVSPTTRVMVKTTSTFNNFVTRLTATTLILLIHCL